MKLEKVKELQLKYVESVLEKFREEADDNQNSAKKIEQYQSLLTLQIKLLCKIRPGGKLVGSKEIGFSTETSNIFLNTFDMRVHIKALVFKLFNEVCV